MSEQRKKRKDFSLNVFGEKWDVKYMSPCFIDGFTPVSGYCDHKNKLIAIDYDHDDGYVAETFFHELFHAYMRRMGVINAGISIELEEIIADQFAMLIAENFDFDL